MKKIPFDFVLDTIFSLNPVVKPMFGCHAIYIGEKIVLILRDKKNNPESNGIWIATSKEYHESLKNEIPSLKTIDVLSGGKGETNWQMISNEDDNFETFAMRICEIIRKGDGRIGKIPKLKKKKNSNSSHGNV